MSGVLIGLVSHTTSATNLGYTNHNMFTHFERELQKETMNVWSCDISASGDRVTPVAVSALTSATNKLESITLIIGNSIIFELNRTILEIASGNSTYESGISTWPINLSRFIPDLDIIRICYHITRIKFKFSEELEQAPTILIKCQYLHKQERSEIAKQKIIAKHIRQVNTLNVNYAASSSVNIKLRTEGVTTGFFLEGAIQQLDKIELYFNNNIYISLRKPYFRTVCKQMSQNVLWMPFNPQTDPWLSNDYSGSINFSSIDNINLKLLFTAPQSNIIIHTVNANIFRTQCGLGELQHIYDTAQATVVVPIFPTTTSLTSLPIWQTANKKIESDRLMCPITYEEIQPSDTYCHCTTCKTNFNENSLKQSFSIGKPECPLCRTPWSNWIIYTNID